MMQHILIFILHTISDGAKLATDQKWYERRSVVLQRLQAADRPKKVRTSVCSVATVATTAKPFYLFTTGAEMTSSLGIETYKLSTALLGVLFFFYMLIRKTSPPRPL